MHEDPVSGIIILKSVPVFCPAEIESVLDSVIMFSACPRLCKLVQLPPCFTPVWLWFSLFCSPYKFNNEFALYANIKTPGWLLGAPMTANDLLTRFFVCFDDYVTETLILRDLSKAEFLSYQFFEVLRYLNERRSIFQPQCKKYIRPRNGCGVDSWRPDRRVSSSCSVRRKIFLSMALCIGIRLLFNSTTPDILWRFWTTIWLRLCVCYVSRMQIWNYMGDQWQTMGRATWKFVTLFDRSYLCKCFYALPKILIILRAIIFQSSHDIIYCFAEASVHFLKILQVSALMTFIVSSACRFRWIQLLVYRVCRENDLRFNYRLSRETRKSWLNQFHDVPVKCFFLS